MVELPLVGRGDSSDRIDDVLLVREPQGEGREPTELSRDLVGVGRNERRLWTEPPTGESILLVLPALEGVERPPERFLGLTSLSAFTGVSSSICGCGAKAFIGFFSLSVLGTGMEGF